MTPVGSRTAFVPYAERDGLAENAAVVVFSGDGADVVIGLRPVQREIAGGAEVLANAFDVRRRHARASHVERADRAGVHTSKQRRTARRTDRRGGKGAREAHTFLREAIEPRRARVAIAVGADVGARVLDQNPQDVRARRRRGLSRADRHRAARYRARKNAKTTKTANNSLRSSRSLRSTPDGRDHLDFTHRNPTFVPPLSTAPRPRLPTW